MTTLPRRSRRVAVVAVAIALFGAGAAVANGTNGNPTPADKAVAAGDTLEVFGPATEVPLLAGVIRTSKPTDLLLQTTLECSILTKLQTGPSTDPGAISTAKAHASIRGWIELDDDPQNNEVPEVGASERVVPVMSTSAPPQAGSTPHSGTPAEDAATFCNRTYERTVQDGEDPLDGIDRETDYIDTKTATAFNWVLLNAGSGVHHVRLVGELVGGGGSEPCARTTIPMESTACTEAFVGNRTLIIEPTKMANDAVVGRSGS